MSVVKKVEYVVCKEEMMSSVRKREHVGCKEERAELETLRESTTIYMYEQYALVWPGHAQLSCTPQQSHHSQWQSENVRKMGEFSFESNKHLVSRKERGEWQGGDSGTQNGRGHLQIKSRVE